MLYLSESFALLLKIRFMLRVKRHLHEITQWDDLLFLKKEDLKEKFIYQSPIRVANIAF